MFDDARISAGLRTMVQGIAAPPTPIHAIHRKIATPLPARKSSGLIRFAVASAAALAIIAFILPGYSSALVQSIEARYRAALQALGGHAPPPVPDALLTKLTPQDATLESARSRVSFALVAPDGLPDDIRSSGIQTVPTGVYSNRTHTWRQGSIEVTFTYHRAGGRSFNLLADRFDPNQSVPGKYLFEAMDPGPGGRPVLVRHRRFAWRNGDQVMYATADAGISAAEIGRIKRAMHGINLPLRELHAPVTGKTQKVYILTKP